MDPTKERLQTAFPYVLLANAAYAANEKEFKKTFEDLAKSNLTDGDQWSVVKSQLLSISNPAGIIRGVQTHTDTQVYVAHVQTDEKVPVLAIAFRGTETDAHDNGGSQSRLSDWATNLDYTLTSITFWDRTEEIPLEKNIQVHNGFLTSFKDVTCTVPGEVDHPETDLQATMNSIMKGIDYHSVVCCGHSLGGALATLCALYCQEVFYAGEKEAPTVSCYTIGSPRVGDKNFAALFDKKVPDSIRIVNKQDPVPAVPLRTQEYRDVGGYIWMKEVGKELVAEPKQRPFGFGQNKVVSDHMSNSYETSIKTILAGSPSARVES